MLEINELMKIIFFGTEGVAEECLKQVTSEFKVVLVVTAPDRPVGRKKVLSPSAVAEIAGKLGLPAYKPASLKLPEVEEILRSAKADCFVTAVFGKIIPQNILEIPPLGNINVHPSLLPKYRGPSPIRTALLNGDLVTGVSIMKMDAQVDHGPVLGVSELAIEKSDTNITLTEKLGKLAGPLLVETLRLVEANSAVETEQDHSKATFTHFFTKQDGKVNWQKTADEIYNQWRACQEWPGIFTTWESKLIKVVSCMPVSGSSQLEVSDKSGLVLEGGVVACGGNTFLQIQKLQLQGKQAVDIQDFLHGHKDFVGATLE